MRLRCLLLANVFLSVQRPSRYKAGLDEDRDEAEMAMVGGKKHSGVELGKTFYALEL
jgi:hypothetical protein